MHYCRMDLHGGEKNVGVPFFFGRGGDGVGLDLDQILFQWNKATNVCRY